ncbi:hypothetical protein CHRY9390_00749 [Chryseobacterium aquaeductus]|uniref:Uncharacterized protein n=1 Tax=Chryseobacterium aquaeductus TaxID=2675056 RepID=A0A9N8MG68_9FLAO|nr:hypothetical protein [Chryseobacterium aquaeductus]CAA7330096.1 hypothetical protein CHRY9390_00749 [Chryseobacterium potabilaquae]CAD7801247.1 hypothetical protein CHRY9390_00749 [Chryseobacterium aquaeductus]
MELREYFQSYKDYFWEWATDDDVAETSGYAVNNLIYFPKIKAAVAYRPYIIEVLNELQLQGWPPFGSLLLALYATQDGYTNMDALISELAVYPSREETQELLSEATEFLEKLQQLDRKYKTKQNRIVLFQTVFSQNRIGVSAKNAEQLYKRYLKIPHLLGESANKLPFNYEAFRKDIRTLAYANRRFSTVQDIIDQMKGFISEPEIEDEVIENELTTDGGKDFIEQLTEDPKTFHVGSLIKRIWSGLKIPMRHLSPGEQPIGGIADMTNKGDLHRMLLSEFANDDEIFMSRIANNEALYIQREIPPEENIFERIILIDTSLKNWGTPKVLAFASAIAVIKHPKAHSDCRVFTLGQTNTAISLNTIQEVIENLNLVSPVLDVADALQQFLEKEHTQKDLEIFFITNQENLNSLHLQKVIHDNRDRLKFLVTTSSDGELNFYKHHKGTRKHIQKIILALKELWENPPQRKNVASESTSYGKKTDLPLNYPILFPTPINKIATFLYEGEFFILSAKKQLLKTYLSDNYYNKDHYSLHKTYRGCEVMIEDISVKPKGQFALAKNKKQEFILCQYQPDKRLISKLNLNTKEYSDLNLSGKGIHHHHQLIYFNKNFYLWHEKASWIEEINIEGNISLENVKNDKEIQKNISKVTTEIERLSNGGNKILSNINFVGINPQNNLMMSKFELYRGFHDALALRKNRNGATILAEKNKNKFMFSEGSEIISDSRGMLTFNSSNKNIPVFYISTSIEGFLAMATKTEFSGSEYYLPENTLLKVKTSEEMYHTYLEAFINQILEYGTEN